MYPIEHDTPLAPREQWIELFADMFVWTTCIDLRSRFIDARRLESTTFEIFASDAPVGERRGAIAMEVSRRFESAVASRHLKQRLIQLDRPFVIEMLEPILDGSSVEALRLLLETLFTIDAAWVFEHVTSSIELRALELAAPLVECAASGPEDERRAARVLDHLLARGHAEPVYRAIDETSLYPSGLRSRLDELRRRREPIEPSESNRWVLDLDHRRLEELAPHFVQRHLLPTITLTGSSRPLAPDVAARVATAILIRFGYSTTELSAAGRLDEVTGRWESLELATLDLSRVPADIAAHISLESLHQLHATLVSTIDPVYRFGSWTRGDRAALIHRVCTRWYRHEYDLCSCLGRGNEAELVTVLADMNTRQTRRIIALIYLGVIDAGANSGRLGVVASAMDRFAEAAGTSIVDFIDDNIPTFGFDVSGRVAIDYGSRRVELELSEDFDVLVRDIEAGTLRPHLPRRRETDDEALVGLQRARKARVVKNVPRLVDLLSSRWFDEALVTFRTWAPSRWREVFSTHPILSRLARTIVWSSHDPDTRELIADFMVDETGEFFGRDDVLIEVDGAHVIALAHPIELGAARSNSWREHKVAEGLHRYVDQLARPHVPAHLQAQAWERLRQAPAPRKLMRAMRRHPRWEHHGKDVRRALPHLDLELKLTMKRHGKRLTSPLPTRISTGETLSLDALPARVASELLLELDRAIT